MPNPITARTAFILNPKARRGEQREEIEQRVRALPEATILLTERAGHAEELARWACEDGFETVVAVGGDGTVHEVVNGLEGHFDQVRFGVLPMGTGNDLCRTVGIPDDLSEALAILQRGEIRQCDLIKVRFDAGHQLFLNVAAFGVNGEVSEMMTPELKRAWGPLAYLRAALETLPDFRQYTVRVDLPEEESLQLELASAIIANGRYAAAGIPVAPTAEIDDGLLDLVLLSSPTLADLATLAAKVLPGNHLEGDDERVLFRRVPKVRITALDEPLPGFADGEPVGGDSTPTTLEFEVLPKALQAISGPDLPTG